MLLNFQYKNISLSVALQSMSAVCFVPSAHDITVSVRLSLTCPLSICTQLIRTDVMGKHRGFADGVVHILAVSRGT